MTSPKGGDRSVMWEVDGFMSEGNERRLRKVVCDFSRRACREETTGALPRTSSPATFRAHSPCHVATAKAADYFGAGMYFTP